LPAPPPSQSEAAKQTPSAERLTPLHSQCWIAYRPARPRT